LKIQKPSNKKVTTKRLYIVAPLLIVFFFTNALYAGSGLDTDSPSGPGNAITILESWQGDFPVSQLDLLPEGQQHLSVGYINDSTTFSAVWNAYNTKEKTPDIDFSNHLVLFVRNTRFYNRISIGRIQVNAGISEVVAMETMSAMPIEGKVAFSMAVIAKKGIYGIRFGNELINIP